jgi:histidinol-phosphate aminotransferase
MYQRSNIARMVGYTPGEQPEDPAVVKLNTNENPYPPSRAVMEALVQTTGEMLRKYPPPLATEFRRTAAQVHGVGEENILATNAGDELLRLVITTFVEPGKPIGTAEPSYSLYPVLADIHGSPTVRVPLLDDWSIPADFADRMNAAGVQLTFIVNPHAPSGLLISVDRLAQIASQLRGVLLVDEAYIDFVDPAAGHDAVQLIKRLDNVLLLRTLSKGYSLAGLRFGYGIGPAALIEPMLTKTKDSYNTDAVAQRLAIAALKSRDDARRTWDAVRVERQRMAGELAAMGLNCGASASNFVLTTVPANRGGGAAGVYESLKRRKIFVRYFDQDRLRDKLRITIGTPEQNSALLDALRIVL